MKLTLSNTRSWIVQSCAVLLLMQMSASAQTLLNRWSFNVPTGSTTVTDSVASVVATLNGGASLDGTQLTLDGGNGSYVDLGGNLLIGVQAASFEGWANSASSPDNVCLFSFDDGAGTGAAYARYVIHDSGNTDNAFELADFSTGQPNQLLKSPVGWGDVPVHVVCIFDPANGVQAIYTNGILQASRTFAVNQTTLSSVSTNSASLGRSPWYAYGDPYMAGTISEFRIWNGALNPLQIAALETAGNGTVSTNYGTVTAIQLQVAFTMQQNTLQQAGVMATASGLTLQPNIASMATYTSGNTNILTVNAKGVITAVAQGSTTITASFSGKTSVQTITVVPPTATLVHRYSFTSDANDSVGTANGTLNGSALISSGTVVLDGSAGTYVGLPNGILTNISAITFETWLTNSATPDNVCQFEFSGGAGTGGSYLRHVIHGSGRDTLEMTSGGFTSLSGTPGYGDRYIHVVCIYDPTAQVEAVFTNGVLESLLSSSSIPAANNLWSYAGSLGRSPWWAFGDPYLNGAFDEFRIYSGELTPQKIAMNYAAGPDNYNTNDQGSLISIALQVQPTMPQGASQICGLNVNYTRLTNFNITANSIFAVGGLTITSSDTNIITISGGKTLVANGYSGTATITAIYQGKTNSTAVTVLPAPHASLIHRYSFNETSGTTAADSVGGVNGTLMGAAAFDGNGWLNFLPDNDTAPGTSYLDISGAQISGLSAVTFDIWATNRTGLNNGECLFAFRGPNSGQNYLRLCARTSGSVQTFEIVSSTQSTALIPLGARIQQTGVHYVCVYDPTTLGYLALYTNGVLAGSATGITVPLSVVGTNYSFIGRSPWDGDRMLQDNINEARIYSGILLPSEIAALQIIGPNAVLTTNVSLTASTSGGNITLSWPVAGAGYGLQSSPSLGADAVWTYLGTPTVVGTTNQITVPIFGSAKFFRLKR